MGRTYQQLSLEERIELEVQVAGPTFYPLHLLFDKHFGEQVEVVDTITERIQSLGGDAAQVTKIAAPPRGREELPVQISRLLEAHKLVMAQCLDISKAADTVGDQGTNDLVVSDVLRINELQAGSSETIWWRCR